MKNRDRFRDRYALYRRSRVRAWSRNYVRIYPAGLPRVSSAAPLENIAGKRAAVLLERLSSSRTSVGVAPCPYNSGAVWRDKLQNRGALSARLGRRLKFLLHLPRFVPPRARLFSVSSPCESVDSLSHFLSSLLLSLII